MKQHSVRVWRATLARLGAAVALACLVALFSIANVYGAGAPPKKHHGSPTGSPTPAPAGVSPTPSSSPVPTGSVTIGHTGQYSDSKPAILYCAGQLYVAWKGTDSSHHLNIGWGSTGGSFPHKVIVNDYFQSSNISGPALACFNPTGGGNRLYVAFRGTDRYIYTGWFNGTSTLQDHTRTGQLSDYSPALTVGIDGNLYLGWTGTDSAHHLNLTFSYNGNDWNHTVYILTDTAAGGPGLATFSGSHGNQLYVAWTGTDGGVSGPDHLNVAYFNYSNTLQDKRRGLDGNQVTIPGNDSALATVGLTLYFPYAGVQDDLNISRSSNGDSWTNDAQIFYAAYEGVSGASYGGALFMVWIDQPGEILMGPYHP